MNGRRSFRPSTDSGREQTAGGPAGVNGTALVSVLVVALALTALAHGMIVVAQREYRVARAGVMQLQARGAAEMGTARLLALGVTPTSYATAVWSTGGAISDSAGRISYTAELLRLSDEFWLVRGEARVGRVVSPVVANAVWIMDPAAQVAAARALVAARSFQREAGTAVETVAFADTINAPPSGCGWGGRVAALRPTLPAVSLSGSFPLALGLLDADSLALRINDTTVVVADGHLRTGGAAGTGLLVGLGDLTLSGHAHSGYIMAAGNVTIESGSDVRGLVRAGGWVALRDSSSIRASACWAAESLALPSLRRPIVLTGLVGPF
ncbi:MAG: hypothetical protein J4G12_02145 [Gemmatimonadetes bacterium]|nr:hypothetical protein [Gemmatimonadota bacterium]